MKYEDALDFHIREFNRQVADLREIMAQNNYDNEDSPEVKRLKQDIMQIVHETFNLKVCHSRAISLSAKPTLSTKP